MMSLDHTVEQVWYTLSSHAEACAHIDVDGLTIRVDSEAHQLVQQVLASPRQRKWPLSMITVLGSPELKKALMHHFEMLTEYEAHVQGWRMVQRNQLTLLWYFDRFQSYGDEVNFIVAEQGSNALTIYSDATLLYGQKQLSVILASLILIAGPYLQIHGSAVLAGERGFVFIGGKKAGKSSMIRGMILAGRDDVTPLTDNITLTDTSGTVWLPTAAFSDELRLYDLPATRRFLESLTQLSGGEIAYYMRNNKWRISLSSIRAALKPAMALPAMIRTVVFLDRQPGNTTQHRLEEADSELAVNLHLRYADPGWTVLWERCPGFETVMGSQTEIAREFYSRDGLHIYRLVLPETAGEDEAAFDLMKHFSPEQ